MDWLSFVCGFLACVGLVWAGLLTAFFVWFVRLTRDLDATEQIPGLPLDTAKQIHGRVAGEFADLPTYDPGLERLATDVGSPPAPKARRSPAHNVVSIDRGRRD